MGKRTKQYKKLMRSFEFLGFRQPYQVLMTSDILLDTMKLDLIDLFEKTLSAKNLKPMITQCCIRALYDMNNGPNRDPTVVAAIERAKTFERRRCGHLMDEDAKSERECMLSVVDPRGNGQNKFRYIVATLDEDLRKRLRSVVPTPLMYVRRSVVILEPMAEASKKVRNGEELAKFKEGIIRGSQKRKRDDGEDAGSDVSGDEDGEPGAGEGAEKKKKKKKTYGPKGPNPLAVKKAKKQTVSEKKPRKDGEPTEDTPSDPKPKRKRRKKGGVAAGGDGEADKPTADAPPVDAAADAED
ncbi:rRNA-processing protein utp23 [Podospora aff. communis PSN243]|uniref:U three protein 23 n=1 Tax=Podospora aff. communis PSN243 TaxID=3040156 RepID=A0AAV9GS33_9PEZI|nr:rRNA-processing protein utp23 [Podospora aff. communis PSN243]